MLHYQRHNWSTGQRELIPIVEGSPAEKVLQEMIDIMFRTHCWREDDERFDRMLRRWKQTLETAPLKVPDPEVPSVAVSAEDRALEMLKAGKLVQDVKIATGLTFREIKDLSRSLAVA